MTKLIMNTPVIVEGLLATENALKMLRSRIIRYFTLIFLLCLFGCRGEKVPDGRIMIKNDTRDSTYNVIRVSASGLDASLKPGEKVLLPRSSLTFTVSRQYQDYVRSYTVQCPQQNGKGIVIKMIDIHVNRIAGKCITTAASKQ